MNEEKSIKKLSNRLSNLLVFVLLFSTLSGALRKWVISSNIFGNIILLVQLLIPFSFSLFSFNKYVVSPFRYCKFLYVYVFLLILFAINPMNLTIYHGILGFVLHFGFWYMMFFYLSNRSLFKINYLVSIAIILCGVEVVLGTIQYQLPDSHVINKYADPNQMIAGIAKVGDKVRITGTFSYLGGIGSFVFFYACVLWYMLRKEWNKQLLIILMVSGLLLAFMTGSRGTTYSYLFVILVMLLSEVRHLVSVQKLILQTALFFTFLFTVNYFLGDRLGVISQATTAWDTFNKRVEVGRKSGEEQGRFIDPLIEVVDFSGKYPLIGVGLGATYQGATAIFGISPYVLEYGYYEGEWGRIILEGGFILFFIRIFLYVYMYRSLKMAGLSKFLIMALIFTMPIVVQTYNSVYLFLGMILLDKSYIRLGPEQLNLQLPFEKSLARSSP